MPKRKVKNSFYPVDQKPPGVNGKILSKVGKLNPLARSLDDAFDEIIQEEKDGKDASNGTNDFFNEVQIDNEFRAIILDKFGKCFSDAFEPIEEEGEKKTKKREDTEAPPALLSGEIKFFNKLGNQWRIQVKNAKIQPRTNVDTTNKRKVSLWDYSSEETERLNKKLENRKESKVMNNFIKIDGELTILGYDDIE